jgi:hypothetical protein
MQLLKGETLQQRLNREGRLSLAETVRIARQTAKGLEVAHRHGLVHRDVKPSNLWLEASTGRVTILDFGLAHTLHNNPQLTGSGVIIGTPAYMAPEQAAGRSVDARSDLFSLGCVLYRMCTGKPAFEGADTLAVLTALATETPAPARDCNAEVPRALSGLIARLLAKNPADRPRSAREVIEHLEEIDLGPSTAEKPAPARNDVVPSAGRAANRRLVAAVAVLGVLAVLVAGSFFLRGLGGDRRAAGKPEPPAQPPAPAASAAKIRLLVPAYFYPGGDGMQHWDRLLASGSSGEIVVIVNPGSGPGAQVDANYSAVLGRVRKAGLRPIGYVSTKHAERPLAEVKADVDRWLRFYPEIQGFFFDEQASAAAKVEYYLAVSQHAREKIEKALIISNPGTMCAPEYLTRRATDVVCVTERSHEDALHLAPGTSEETSRRFAVLIYGVDQAERMRQLMQQAIKDRVGYVLVTEGKQPNPWDRLPTWWEAERAIVHEANSPGGAKEP